MIFSTDQSRSVTPAAIAGVMRKLVWRLRSLFRREFLGARLPTLLAAELSESHGGRILSRIGIRAILVDLACCKIDDELCELVCVPRALA
jgi:hypothetical protein